jgi:hypothetical protein
MRFDNMAGMAQISGSRRTRPAPDKYELTDRGITFYYSDGTSLSQWAPYASLQLDKWLHSFRAEDAERI